MFSLNFSVSLFVIRVNLLHSTILFFYDLLLSPWCFSLLVIYILFSGLIKFKVHLTPKHFFRSNKSLHLSETHCAFLPRFNPNLDFLHALKVTKSWHYLLYDRASKGYGSIPGWTEQTDLHRKSLCKHACKSVSDVHPGIDPYPLLARSCNRWWPDFVTFTACKKSRFGLKWGILKRRNVFQTGTKIYLSEKNILGLGALKLFITRNNFFSGNYQYPRFIPTRSVQK